MTPSFLLLFLRSKSSKFSTSKKRKGRKYRSRHSKKKRHKVYYSSSESSSAESSDSGSDSGSSGSSNERYMKLKKQTPRPCETNASHDNKPEIEKKVPGMCSLDELAAIAVAIDNERQK